MIKEERTKLDCIIGFYKVSVQVAAHILFPAALLMAQSGRRIEFNNVVPEASAQQEMTSPVLYTVENPGEGIFKCMPNDGWGGVPKEECEELRKEVTKKAVKK